MTQLKRIQFSWWWLILVAIPIHRTGPQLYKFHTQMYSFFWTQVLNAMWWPETTIPVKHDGYTYTVKFYVVNRNASNILGADACLKLNLVWLMNAIYSSESESQYTRLFEGLGGLMGKYSIKLIILLYPPFILLARYLSLSKIKMKKHKKWNSMRSSKVKLSQHYGTTE